MFLNPMDKAVNTHDLLIKALMCEAGLLGQNAVSPSTFTTSIAISFKRISGKIATDWVESDNILWFEINGEEVLLPIDKTSDAKLLLFLHALMKGVSDRGCQSPMTYIERVVYPSITYMLSQNKDAGRLIKRMIDAESNLALRTFTQRQVDRVIGRT